MFNLHCTVYVLLILVGYIAAVDSVNPTVFVINPEDGNLVKWFDCSQHMKEPSDIAVSMHEFYICDFKVRCCLSFSLSTNATPEYYVHINTVQSVLAYRTLQGHCVTVFNEMGQYLRKLGGEGLTSYPNGIDLSEAGDLLVGDSHGNRFHVVVFSRDGSTRAEFECNELKVSRCCGLKLTSDGYVVTLAKNNHHVLVLNTLYIADARTMPILALYSYTVTRSYTGLIQVQYYTVHTVYCTVYMHNFLQYFTFSLFYYLQYAHSIS